MSNSLTGCCWSCNCIVSTFSVLRCFFLRFAFTTQRGAVTVLCILTVLSDRNKGIREKKIVLSNYSSHSPTFFKCPLPDLNTNESPTACVKQVANYLLPSILLNQDEKLAKVRSSAADSYLSTYTIPLFAGNTYSNR